MATVNSIGSSKPIQVTFGGSGAATLTGLLTGNGTSAFTANAVTQYGTVVAGASNAVSSIAPSATTGIPFISQGAASNPTFGTAVVAGGGTGAVTFDAYNIIFAGTTSTGAFQDIGSVGTLGQVLTSAGAGALPTWETPSAGGTNWSVITADQAAVAGNGYITNKGSLLTLTLPASGAIGDIIEVSGINAGGWKIAQNANQFINIVGSTTTVGASGSLASSETFDSIKIVCTTAGASTGWNVVSVTGNITIV